MMEVTMRVEIMETKRYSIVDRVGYQVVTKWLPKGVNEFYHGLRTGWLPK